MKYSSFAKLALIFLVMCSVSERFFYILDSIPTEENHVSNILLLSTVVIQPTLMTCFAALLDVL